MLRRVLLFLHFLAGLAAFSAAHAANIDGFYSSDSSANAGLTACAAGSYYGAYPYPSVSSNYCAGSPSGAPLNTCGYQQKLDGNLCRVFVVTDCPSGQIFNAQGQCVTAPPVTCPDNQHDVSGVCTPDTAEPAVGSQSPQAVAVGTCDANQENCVLDPGFFQNQSYPVNCGGWQCSASAVNSTSPANCYSSSATPTVLYCDLIPQYTGGGAYVPTTNSSSAPSGTIQASAVCPSGYVLGADGVCRAGSTTGTATTFTDPSQQAVAGTATCPAGYTLGADGSCHGTFFLPPTINSFVGALVTIRLTYFLWTWTHRNLTAFTNVQTRNGVL